MWTNQTKTEIPESSPSPESKTPPTPLSVPAAPIRPASPTISTVRNLQCLGASLTVKGEISGDEDLQIDGKVEGQVSLRGRRLTVGRTGQLTSEVTAGEVVVYGKVSGNVHARDRVEIKAGGDVTGDILTARISIEDGADFKGRIEIDSAKSHEFHVDGEFGDVPIRHAN
jgi:cytoskeletal protein CcmA (bactofilin family)